MNHKKFATWTLLLGKHILKMPVISILLLFIPLITYSIKLLPSNAMSSDVRIGIYFEKNEEELTQLIKAQLLSENNSSFSFTEYTEAAAMEKDVMLGVLECGYIFDAGFSASLSDEKNHSMNHKNKIQVIKSPSSMMQSAIDEIVFSAIVHISGYKILDDYIHIDGIDENTAAELHDYMYTSYEAYCTSGETFHLDIVTVNNISINDTEKESAAIAFPLRGLLAILIFLAAMSGCIAWLKDRESGLFAPRPRSFYMLSSILYPLLPAMLFTLCSELALFIDGSAYAPSVELFYSLRYIALVTAFASLCRLLRKSSLVTSLIPVLLLGSLIFCPIFVNIENFSPAFRFISRLFVPRYFL